MALDLLAGLRGELLDLADPLLDPPDETVAARTRPVAHHQDAVAGTGDVEDRGEPHRRGARVGVPDHGTQQPLLDLPRREAQLPGRAQGELAVGLVEDGPAEVLGPGAASLHEPAGAREDVLDVGGLPREAPGVARVVPVLAPPEIGGVRHVGVRVLAHGDGALSSEDEGRRPRRGRVLERVAGRPLRGVGTDGEHAVGGARAHDGSGVAPTASATTVPLGLTA
jgi:hypothetical protein